MQYKLIALLEYYDFKGSFQCVLVSSFKGLYRLGGLTKACKFHVEAPTSLNKIQMLDQKPDIKITAMDPPTKTKQSKPLLEFKHCICFVIWYVQQMLK